MDLIPIIEYTLLIFIGLLLLVVLTSYLLFALRKNKKNTTQYSGPAREYLYSEPDVKYLIPVRHESSANRSIQYYDRSPYENTNQKSPRFTILNSNEAESSGYTRERVTSFEYRFAPNKSKDAFAMFK